MSELNIYDNSISSTIEYLDNRFDKLVDNFRTASEDLEIGGVIFLNANEAEGTEAMVESTAELKDIVEMTNRFKTFMSTDIANLMNECAENLRSADQAAAESIAME